MVPYVLNVVQDMIMFKVCADQDVNSLQIKAYVLPVGQGTLSTLIINVSHKSKAVPIIMAIFAPNVK